MPREIDLMVMRGFVLCTYEILYFQPDRPGLLAPAFVMQRHDLAPHFPELRKFLDFWASNLEGRLHSVRVASRRMIRPAEFRFGEELRLH